MVFEFDDFGCNHEISDMCQSHDCRDALTLLKQANEGFKVTLFSIPDQMTPELFSWANNNKSWVELAWHGFGHYSNYECEKMTYLDMDLQYDFYKSFVDMSFSDIFRAPGWQISTEAMQWLKDHDWIIADQGYNDGRRPEGMKAYVNYDGVFKVAGQEVPAHHGHTWNCVGNGIYETLDYLKELVSTTTEFKFVSELFT